MICKKCSGDLRHIKTDYIWTQQMNKKVLDKLYICEKCDTEWIKPINHLL